MRLTITIKPSCPWIYQQPSCDLNILCGQWPGYYDNTRNQYGRLNIWPFSMKWMSESLKGRSLKCYSSCYQHPLISPRHNNRHENNKHFVTLKNHLTVFEVKIRMNWMWRMSNNVFCAKNEPQDRDVYCTDCINNSHQGSFIPIVSGKYKGESKMRNFPFEFLIPQ